jgi:hypothetical protein
MEVGSRKKNFLPQRTRREVTKGHKGRRKKNKIKYGAELSGGDGLKGIKERMGID